MNIHIDIDNTFAGCIKAAWLKSLVKRSLQMLGCSEKTEVGLVITGQGRIRELNKKYLHEDRPTDVLSFPMLEGSDKGVFVVPPDGITRLGDVFVSFPEAVLQSEEHGYSVEREIIVLIVHGLLHLLGYDHAEANEKKKMNKKENKILGELWRVEQ